MFLVGDVASVAIRCR